MDVILGKQSLLVLLSFFIFIIIQSCPKKQKKKQKTLLSGGERKFHEKNRIKCQTFPSSLTYTFVRPKRPF